MNMKTTGIACLTVGALIAITGEGREIVLSNSHGTVRIDSVGALVTSYVPTGGSDVFFRQTHARKLDESWYNGGVPICWPWFNKQGDPGSIQHGFARVKEWTLVSSENRPEESRAHLRLEEKGNYRLDYEVVLNDSLSLRLEMRNLGQTHFVVTTGLHPYFAVSDISNVTLVTPIGEFVCSGRQDTVHQMGEGTYLVLDRGTGRKLSLRMFGNTRLIVWNVGPGVAFDGFAPDDWKKYICVEPAIIPRADGFYLEPGECRSLGMICTAIDKSGRK